MKATKTPIFATEQEAVDYVTATYAELVNETPILQSILYDINLLPEQVKTGRDARFFHAMCLLYLKMKEGARS